MVAPVGVVAALIVGCGAGLSVEAASRASLLLLDSEYVTGYNNSKDIFSSGLYSGAIGLWLAERFEMSYTRRLEKKAGKKGVKAF